MQRDGEKRLVRRDVLMSVHKIGAGWSAGTRDSAIPDTLSLVAVPVELEYMIAIGGNLKMDESMEHE